jgi:hypothetical protein
VGRRPVGRSPGALGSLGPGAASLPSVLLPVGWGVEVKLARQARVLPCAAEIELEANRIYRTTYMFSATMPPAVERLAR